jgi:hypothetical protein
MAASSFDFHRLELFINKLFSNDVGTALISEVEFSEGFRPAIAHVFGKIGAARRARRGFSKRISIMSGTASSKLSNKFSCLGYA